MGKNEVLAFSQSIPGYYEPLELEQLYNQVMMLPRYANILEVGVEFGRSASIYFQLAKGGMPLNIFLVDDWSSRGGYEGFTKMISDHFIHIPYILLSLKSIEAYFILERRRFDLIHIDADHEAEGVWKDCELWLPTLVPGGVAIFHDYQRKDVDGKTVVFPGVDKAVDFFTDNAFWEDLGTHGTQAKRRKI